MTIQYRASISHKERRAKKLNRFEVLLYVNIPDHKDYKSRAITSGTSWFTMPPLTSHVHFPYRTPGQETQPFRSTAYVNIPDHKDYKSRAITSGTSWFTMPPLTSHVHFPRTQSLTFNIYIILYIYNMYGHVS